jgi:mono/diheme cytochrome c family protein
MTAARASLLLSVVASLALGTGALATTASAQGVSFGAPGRVPREHDTDIGASTTGDPSLDFVLHCQGCHQAAGLGLPGAVPELKDSVARFASIPGGREYLARVPGVAQSQLDDAAIAALLNWMLPYFDSAHLPADFRPFTAGEVGPLRRSPLVGASVMRASLLANAADAH